MYEPHSELAGPIASLDLMSQSLLFAEASRIAYLSEEFTSRAAKKIGFSQVHFHERDGSQAYILENEIDCVVACRGTEPNDWNDIKADVDAISILAETIGRVHRGFKQEVDDLWPVLEKALIANKKSLWFTGHSLGGAMATICAGRCFLSHIPSTPEGLYTYGSPRVGNTRYVNHVKLNYIRWVNNNDIVTHVPPAWMRYRHTGQEMYINAYGRVREMTGWQRTKDRWRGFWEGIKQGKIDNFSDHSIMLYIEYIQDALAHLNEGDADRKTEQAVNEAEVKVEEKATEQPG